MRLGPIDEYRFMLSPILLGAGNPLFRGGHERLGLRLVEARPTSSGVVLLRYVPGPSS